MKRFFRRNGLSLAMAACFLLFWALQAFTGWHVRNEECRLAREPLMSFGRYLHCGHFWGATGENWESEFLQMGAYVVVTCFLYQKGSAESKDPDAAEEPDPGARRHGWIYRNSLSLAFVALFLGSFVIHAEGSLIEENHDRMRHGEAAEKMAEFLSGPKFWFQSFQNWQSEFLAVLAIVTLTIFLRQQGSPESKKVGAKNSDTGA